MDVKVLFYGVLADVAGTSFKSYAEVQSFGDLKLRIFDDFPEIVNYKYSIFHNNVVADEDPVLNNGDEVALLPPFFGG